MILVADSGSTKTDWALINKAGESKFFVTPGFNPYYMKSEAIEEIVIKDLVPLIDQDSVEEIYYYGSGCSTDKKKMVIDNALDAVFPHARITVEHDLLGAARGLFKNEEGLACILGTGSNSCHFKNGEIIENIPSIGYIYGDEGSGTYMGKSLLTSYLKNRLPNELAERFDKKYQLNLEQILDATYNKEKPMQFMASFVKFISENSEHEYMNKLIRNSFEAFLQHQLFRYSRYMEVPIGFVGSIAFVFKDILENVLKKYDLKLYKITQQPIKGLAEYHFAE